jgi:hypothetical protein
VVASDFDEATPEGEAYTAHLYEADLPLQSTVSADSLRVTPTDPSVRLELNGIGLLDPTGAVQSLDLADRDGLQRVNQQVIRNTRALPRAFVIPLTQAFSPARHPGLTATQLVASPDVDLHTMVLIENDPNTPAAPSGSVGIVPATRVEDVGPNAVRVTASAESPSYLVLDDFYHRGWTARVDGQPARVFIANALFRAVALEPGPHVIEFRFEPLSHLLGAAISAVSLLVVLGALAWALILRRTLRT